MEAIGLPASRSVYGTQALIVGAISGLVNVSKIFGPSVTVVELLGAGTVPEGLIVTVGMSGAWYLGGAIGSAAVATGRHFACGTQIIDVLGYAARNRLLTPQIQRQLVAHPEIYDASRPNRIFYGHMAKAAA